MARIIWWDEGTFPTSFDQAPAVEALEVVVMRAEPVE